jgi:hypothetical protein
MFLAKMGLVVHDDPAKVISAEGREWGPETDGLALSIKDMPSFDSEAQPEVTAVVMNRGDRAQTLQIPGWLFYFQYEVETMEGEPVEPGSFGRQLLRPERRTEKLEITLAPGAHTATEIPIGSIYGLRARTPYRIRLRAGKLVSNPITVGRT